MTEDDLLLQKLHTEGITLATINRRGFAMFIDEMIISFLFFFMIKDHLAALTSPEEIVAYTQSLMIYVLVIKIIYQALFVGLYGATLGKMALKIKVVDRDYLDIPSWQQSIVRSIMRVVDEMLFYLGFVVALFSPLKVTWHDRFAKTLVVDA
jgi:uncharacterized RDD family membrane protein YckC